MKDLTHDKPYRVIMMFALPIMAGYILQQLYNMVDGKIVSTYVGTEAFAAVGATAVVSNTIVGFINGMTQGFAIPIANAFGANDYKRMRKNVAGTIKLTIFFAIFFTILSLLGIEGLLEILNTPDDIMADALTYVRIILAGIALATLYNVCANILRAVGDSRTPLICLIVAVVINIALDLLFVKVFDWGIAGAAYATIISQGISGVTCAFFIWKKFPVLLPHKDEWTSLKEYYGTLISTGVSMGLMSCVVNIGTITLQGAINSLGTAIVAAHTAARRVFDILTVTLFSVGVAMTTFVSQNMGAGRIDRVKKGIKQSVIIVMLETIALIVICFLFARPVFEWITSTSDAEIIDSAVMYSRVSILFFFVLGPLFIMRCSLQGMGRRVIPVMSSVIEMLVKIISANVLVPVFGYVGVAFTEPISWIFMLIMLIIAYFTSSPEKYLKNNKK